jgi:transposase
MRPRLWRPPIELSGLEQSIVKRIKKAKLFTFLRIERHELFNESFQEELARMYAEQPKGHPPVPPAQGARVVASASMATSVMYYATSTLDWSEP